MGEIADAIINGEFDFITGVYLGKGAGYPRTRTNFKNRSKVKAGRNYQSNKSKVWRLMFCDGNPANLSETILFLIVQEYIHAELKLPQKIKETTAYKHVLKDERRFKNWYAEKYPNYSKHVTRD